MVINEPLKTLYRRREGSGDFWSPPWLERCGRFWRLLESSLARKVWKVLKGPTRVEGYGK